MADEFLPGNSILSCITDESLVFVSLVQLQSINESMEKLVEDTNIKTAAANDMRDAIRLRTDSLKNMRLTDDIFERDSEYQRFISSRTAVKPREINVWVLSFIGYMTGYSCSFIAESCFWKSFSVACLSLGRTSAAGVRT